MPEAPGDDTRGDVPTFAGEFARGQISREPVSISSTL